MGDPLLNPTTLDTAATYEDAGQIVDALLTVTHADDLADLLEHAVDKSDRAHIVIYLLLSRLRGWDSPETGLSFVQTQPTLYLPGDF